MVTVKVNKQWIPSNEFWVRKSMYFLSVSHTAKFIFSLPPIICLSIYLCIIHPFFYLYIYIYELN